MAARGTATVLTVPDTAYPASNYTHPTPVPHAMGAGTAVYYGPW